MAKDETKKIRPALLQADTDSFAAAQGIPDYAPVNKDYTIAKVMAAQNAMIASQAAETKARAAFDGARDDATADEWTFHNLVLGLKTQVKAQYGENSNELQAVGLTKKSEFHRPSARTTPTRPPK